MADRDYGPIENWGVDISGLLESSSCGLTRIEEDVMCGTVFERLVFSRSDNGIELDDDLQS